MWNIFKNFKLDSKDYNQSRFRTNSWRFRDVCARSVEVDFNRLGHAAHTYASFDIRESLGRLSRIQQKKKNHLTIRVLSQNPRAIVSRVCKIFDLFCHTTPASGGATDKKRKTRQKLLYADVPLLVFVDLNAVIKLFKL